MPCWHFGREWPFYQSSVVLDQAGQEPEVDDGRRRRVAERAGQVPPSRGTAGSTDGVSTPWLPAPRGNPRWRRCRSRLSRGIVRDDRSSGASTARLPASATNGCFLFLATSSWLASPASDGITVPTPAHGVYHGPFGIKGLYLPNGPWCHGQSQPLETVSHHLQSQVLQAGGERETRDRCRQQTVDRCDHLDEEVELALVAFGPVQLHLLAERRGMEPGGQEPVHRAERGAERPGQVIQHHEPVQVVADRRIDPEFGHGGGPVPVERGPVGRPHVLRDLQGGAESAAFLVDGGSGGLLRRALQPGVDRQAAAVPAPRHPPLKSCGPAL